MILANTLPPQAIPTHTLATRPSKNHAIEPVVYFFLDFWNITISATHLAASNGDGIYADRRIRLSWQNLRALAERGRVWGAGYSAAGTSYKSANLRNQMAQAGINIEVSELGARSGSEQNVDERIQLEMYRLLQPEIPRGVVVLATGDGAGSDNGRGYLPAIQQLSKSGFEIEVMSWEHSFNRKLRNWAEAYGRAIVLDPFYAELTFVPGGRKASHVNSLYRKIVQHRLN